MPNKKGNVEIYIIKRDKKGVPTTEYKTLSKKFTCTGCGESYGTGVRGLEIHIRNRTKGGPLCIDCWPKPYLL